MASFERYWCNSSGAHHFGEWRHVHCGNDPQFCSRLLAANPGNAFLVGISWATRLTIIIYFSVTIDLSHIKCILPWTMYILFGAFQEACKKGGEVGEKQEIATRGPVAGAHVLVAFPWLCITFFLSSCRLAGLRLGQGFILAIVITKSTFQVLKKQRPLRFEKQLLISSS